MRSVRWNNHPRGVMETPLLKIFESTQDKILENVFEGSSPATRKKIGTKQPSQEKIQILLKQAIHAFGPSTVAKLKYLLITKNLIVVLSTNQKKDAWRYWMLIPDCQRINIQMSNFNASHTSFATNVHRKVIHNIYKLDQIKIFQSLKKIVLNSIPVVTSSSSEEVLPVMNEHKYICISQGKFCCWL